MTAPAPQELSDAEIVGRVLAGETALFEVLMRRHNRKVFRAARAVLRRDAEAEDAMQDAYVAAYEHLKDLEDRPRFATWVARIAVREALQRLRREKRLVSLDDETPDTEGTMTTSDGRGSDSPEAHASDVELRSLLENAVDQLPIAFRTVFVMRAVEEMSVGETAEALDIPEETVRTRLHRARGLLREDLARKLESAAPATFDFHLSRCDRVVDAVLRRIRG